MSEWDFTPDEEDQLFTELNQLDQKAQSYRATANPAIAQTAGDLYRTHPYATPGTVLSTAKAVASGAMTREAADRIIAEATKNAVQWSTRNPPEKKKKSWWERNIVDKAKSASRWTMAGLNFVPQAAVGLVAQPFTDNPKGQKGWFISTDIGTLIANDEVAGEGWFMGGRAAQLQAERAREYRGEIDGHAFTIGRGIATTFLQPGTKEYNILSGLVDAGVALAVPSVPGLGVAKGAVKGASEMTGLRLLAGLTEAESAAIDAGKVASWLRSSSGGAVVKRIAKIENVDEAMRIFPRVDDPSFWTGVVDAKTDKQVIDFLEGTLGTSGPRNIADINLSRLDDIKAGLVGRSNLVSKWMASVPGQHLVLQGGNPRDAAQSVRNMNNYLKLLKVEDTNRAKLIDDYTKALVDANGDVYQVVGEFQKVMDASLEAAGVPDDARRLFIEKMREFKQNKATYGAGDDLGDPTSFGAKVPTTDGKIVDAPIATAALESEQLRALSVTLPDPRQVRRMMSKVGWVTGKKGIIGDATKAGQLRMPLAALEAFQQEIWRPITLMTGGYVLRNLTDSALRTSTMPTLKGGVFHPVQWIQIASYKKFRGDILGQAFDPDTAEKLLKGAQDEFAEAVGQGLREGVDPISRTRREVATKNWAFARRSSGPEFRKGIQDEVSLLHDDFVTRSLAQGIDPDELVRELMNTEYGRKYLRNLQGRWTNRTLTDDAGRKSVGTVEIYKADGSINEDTVRVFVNDYAAKRLQSVTKDNQLLVDAIADGTFRNADGELVDIFDFKTKRVEVSDQKFQRMQSERKGYAREWDDEVQKLIDSGAELKDSYKYRIEGSQMAGEAGKNPQVRRMLAGWNKSTDYFFSSLYPRRSAYLMQSPAFRQFYYKQVGFLADELTSTGVTVLRDTLQKAASAEGKVLNIDWLSDYVGDSKLATKLSDIVTGKTVLGKGKLELDQLDAYAKGFALDETKRLFYNATERSNFADILRIVAPFGSAWAEVMSSWGKIATTNPEAIRKVGITVQGLKNADPDNDGKGFFWKDPVTGEYVFNYPFSKQLGPLVSGLGGIGAVGGLALGGLGGAAIGGLGGAGVGAGLQAAGLATPGTTMFAPAKTLTMGFNFLPGVGPFTQIAASKILGNRPEADAIMKFIAPYGEPDIYTLGPVPVPSWGQKLIAALRDPENDRLLGDLTIDVMRVLNQTGTYNLADPAEQERLEKDATGRARTLLMMRALGQFVGPTRPDVDFKVETYKGDMYTREISKAFRVLQDENYDAAVEKFLDAFGDDAFLYVASKSKATVGGLDASTQFGQFERENKSLFGRYKDVAGYFAPVGENFDYQVYLRQLTTGKREKLKPSEYIEEAQSQVGRALYRSLTRQAGPNPNANQQAVLREVRGALIKMFPGFGTTPVDINRQSAQIQELIGAAGDPLLDGNPVAEGLRQYLTLRDQALMQAQARGFTTLAGKKVADLRGLLRSAADQIIQQYPEFERLYDRVLFNEIDIDA